ncbi:MAG TPA: hypothetical protein VF548_00840 [Allosphingosinicella sp.]|jgi:hypothetical protein
MRRISAALCLAACLAAAGFGSPALAASPPPPAGASFRVGGVEFQLPLPPGYCLPRGLQVDVAQLVAAGDTANVTDLTLFPCTAPASGPELGNQKDYILIKTPKQAMVTQVTRKDLLAGLGEAFDNPAFTEALNSGKLMKDAGQGVSNVVGTKIDLSGNVAPRGKDDVCAYLGGAMTVTSAVKSYALSVGACITAVGGRILTIYWYGPDEGPASVARLLVKAKGVARTITSRADR